MASNAGQSSQGKEKVSSPLVRKNSVPVPPAGSHSLAPRTSKPMAKGPDASEPKNTTKTAVLRRATLNPAQMAQVSNQVRDMIEGSTIRPIQPARQYDVISMARAMNREQFAERVQQIFETERDAALLAMQRGQYISWRCPDQNHDCQRIGLNGRCFCGHSLGEHREWDGHAVAVPCNFCKCRAFAWVPSKPEEVGEFWLRRRPDFDEGAYRAKCKCKHSHEQHDPNGDRRCLVKGCARCMHFTSAFLCAACDRHWELHSTFFENQQMRRREGRAVGEDYLPFAEAPGLKRIVMGGEDRGFDTLEDAIADRQGPHQLTASSQAAIQGPRRKTIAAPPAIMPRGGTMRGGNDDPFIMPPR